MICIPHTLSSSVMYDATICCVFLSCTMRAFVTQANSFRIKRVQDLLLLVPLLLPSSILSTTL